MSVRFSDGVEKGGELGAAYAPVDKDVDPDLPVEERILDVLPPKLLGLGNLGAVRVGILALVLEPVDDEGSLFLG